MDKPDLSTVPGRVRHLRSLTGLSARSFGELAGLSAATVAGIESKAAGGLQTETARAIASAYGADASWLAFAKGRPPSKERAAFLAENAAQRVGKTIDRKTGRLVPLAGVAS